MTTIKSYKPLIILLFFLISPILQASDLAKEKRWADQIVDALLVGEAEWLPVGDQKVLSIYAPSETEPAHGAAIILHGVGVHPNWDQIIRPVRSQLPEYGWSTLSVQMPILPNDAKLEEYAELFDEVGPRLNAAVSFLKDEGIKNIVIIAHSLGSAMAAYYLRENPDSSVKALVAIGATGSHFIDEDKNYLKSLTTIKVPVMDIFGAIDEPDVMETADKKVAVARESGNKQYTQIKVEGADHFFNGKQEILVQKINDWITQFAAEK